MNNMVINGKFVQGESNVFKVINPANETIVKEIHAASKTQVELAVEASLIAFEAWKNTSDHQIQEIFNMIRKDLNESKDEIATIITQEQGKLFALAEMEVELALLWIDYIFDLKIPVEIIHEKDNKIIEVYNRPLGVIASITPWNWPFMIAVWHIFPALKAKNCVVNKPSEYTPLSTIKLIEIINRYLPKGVCNIVLGSAEVGQHLTQHSGIAKITFTGSTKTGQHILARSAENLKAAVLELGGNDAAIVLEDVNLDEIAQKIFDSAFLNSGQTCAAIKRLYVHKNVYEKLSNKLTEIADSQVVGDGFNPLTTFGPLQNKQQYLKVKQIIQEAIAQGGVVLSNNKPLSHPGYFIRPTIITGVKEGTRVVDEEQFGPVLPIIQFDHLDEVIKRANNSTFGLAASVWSNNINLAKSVADQIEAGTVWINSHSDLSPAAVFGGWKLSGLGYSFGLDGLLLFTRKQAIHIS